MINGHIKFFEKNLASVQEGASANASDGTEADRLIAENNETFWQSLGRAGEVTIEINLPPARANRIILLDHNLANFSISGEFTNLTDIKNEELSSIDIQANREKTSYFAFDQERLTSLTLNLGNTINPGEFKRIGRLILCNEFTTLEGWPEMRISFNDNARKFKSKAGELQVSKQRRTMERLSLAFKNYTKLADIEAVQELHRLDDSVLIWPCGGREDFFRFQQEGFRLQDIYKVKSMGQLPIMLDKGSYSSLLDTRITFYEVI